MWCNGNILASHAADRGSNPGWGRSASSQTLNSNSLQERTTTSYLTVENSPPTALPITRNGEHDKVPGSVESVWRTGVRVKISSVRRRLRSSVLISSKVGLWGQSPEDKFCRLCISTLKFQLNS